GTWKFIDERNPITGIAFIATRPDYGVFGFQPLPSDAGVVGHGLAHLSEYFARTIVVPVQTDATGNLLDNPQVLFGFAGRVQRLAAHLYQTVGIGECTIFFHVYGRRQHDIGEPRGFGEENILDDEVFKLRKGLPYVGGIRIGHG